MSEKIVLEVEVEFAPGAEELLWAIEKRQDWLAIAIQGTLQRAYWSAKAAQFVTAPIHDPVQVSVKVRQDQEVRGGNE